MSPIVYEPDTALLRLAFELIDLSNIIPFTSFYTGSIQPSIPPKTLLLTAEFDVLRDEGEAYAKKLRMANVSVTSSTFKRPVGFLALAIA